MTDKQQLKYWICLFATLPLLAGLISLSWWMILIGLGILLFFVAFRVWIFDERKKTGDFYKDTYGFKKGSLMDKITWFIAGWL